MLSIARKGASAKMWAMKESYHQYKKRIGDIVEIVNKVYGHLYPNKHNEVADKLNKLNSTKLGLIRAF